MEKITEKSVSITKAKNKGCHKKSTLNSTIENIVSPKCSERTGGLIDIYFADGIICKKIKKLSSDYSFIMDDKFFKILRYMCFQNGYKLVFFQLLLYY